MDKLVRPQVSNDFKPPVKSKIYRQSGVIPKVRLVDYASLRTYLDSLPDGQQLLKNLKKKETT